MWAAPVVVVLGLVAAVGGYVFAGGPEPIRKMLGLETQASNKLPAETRVECTNVKHAYENWHEGLADLTTLDKVAEFKADFDARDLVEDADTLADATNNYPDKASKQLRLDVLSYRFAIGLVDIQLSGTNVIDLELFLAALEAWEKVEKSYKAFSDQTCT